MITLVSYRGHVPQHTTKWQEYSMTEPDHVQEPDEEARPVRHNELDFVLQLFAKAAHEGVGEFGLTLSLNGSLVCGTVVGRDKWFRELGEWAESQVDGGGILPGFLGEMFAEDDKALGPEGIPVSNFGFIHLKNARVFGGSTSMPRTGIGMFWRCRLSQVSGWSLGTLSDD